MASDQYIYSHSYRLPRQACEFAKDLLVCLNDILNSEFELTSGDPTLRRADVEEWRKTSQICRSVNVFVPDIAIGIWAQALLPDGPELIPPCSRVQINLDHMDVDKAVLHIDNLYSKDGTMRLVVDVLQATLYRFNLPDILTFSWAHVGLASDRYGGGAIVFDKQYRALMTTEAWAQMVGTIPWAYLKARSPEPDFMTGEIDPAPLSIENGEVFSRHIQFEKTIERVAQEIAETCRHDSKYVPTAELSTLVSSAMSSLVSEDDSEPQIFQFTPQQPVDLYITPTGRGQIEVLSNSPDLVRTIVYHDPSCTGSDLILSSGDIRATTVGYEEWCKDRTPNLRLTREYMKQFLMDKES